MGISRRHGPHQLAHAFTIVPFAPDVRIFASSPAPVIRLRFVGYEVGAGSALAAAEGAADNATCVVPGALARSLEAFRSCFEQAVSADKLRPRNRKRCAANMRPSVYSPRYATQARVMSLRLRGLSEHDPRAVALPHGTEVVTRVDRAVGVRVVPEGSVGRVVGTASEGIDVNIVGTGVVRYARDELVPRRAGQRLFAERREQAWEALSRCVVLETRVGSHAWNLAEQGSDEDWRGVFAAPLPWWSGLVSPPE